MRKLATVLGLVVASVVVLAGCASQCNTCPKEVAPVVHHDYKCETGHKK